MYSIGLAQARILESYHAHTQIATWKISTHFPEMEFKRLPVTLGATVSISKKGWNFSSTLTTKVGHFQTIVSYAD